MDQYTDLREQESEDKTNAQLPAWQDLTPEKRHTLIRSATKSIESIMGGVVYSWADAL